MSNWYDPGFGEHIVVDGHIVERDALRVVEALKAINPDLEVVCLDPNYIQGVNEAPFIVCEPRKSDGKLVRIMEAWTLDNQLIERVRLADTWNTDVLDNLVKKEEALKRDQERKKLEQKEANVDLVSHIVANRKSRYTFETESDTVTIFDDRPSERQEKKL